ncbi:hypothetical protein, partial [Burkholderia cenocepacia]|uniref:hypothetical protein n=1 Tax=Burkholderia cenocepacia TaxID=95486 RepID=UPI001B8E806D
LLMVDGLLFAGFRLRQSDSQLKPPPPSTSRLNSPYTTSDFSSSSWPHCRNGLRGAKQASIQGF